MFWAVVFMVAAGHAAKLDNAYLPPPPSAKDAGGSDGSLEVPLEPPYIDPYTPEAPGTHSKAGTRSLGSNANRFIENEDEIVSQHDVASGKFISGSYSYTGPDNVLVTVTYKAADKMDQKAEEDAEEEEEDQEVVVAADAEEEEGEDDVIPTPRTLPAELSRAFDFHKRKQNNGPESKTHKKPIRGAINKHRNQQKGQHQDHIPAGSKTPNREGYHYAPHPQYVPPSIDQGYSYPKHG